MIEGVLRHDTDMEIERQYVDSHGQSEVAFAFCRLLGFQLLPRLKAITAQRLYLPEAGITSNYPNLACILARPIDWTLIEQQYDEMVRYATAMSERTADPETATLHPQQHPTSDLQGAGRAGQSSEDRFPLPLPWREALRREVHEGLNVVESWNSANGFIFFGKGGEVASNRLDDQEVSVHALHLLQSCLAYVNTLMLQRVLVEPTWLARLRPGGQARSDPARVGSCQPVRRL